MALRVISSGIKTADVAIKAGKGAVYWITVAATAAGVVGLADSLTNSTTYVWQVTLPTNGYIHAVLDPALHFSTGIWLDVASGTVVVTVGYL